MKFELMLTQEWQREGGLYEGQHHIRAGLYNGAPGGNVYLYQCPLYENRSENRLHIPEDDSSFIQYIAYQIKKDKFEAGNLANGSKINAGGAIQYASPIWDCQVLAIHRGLRKQLGNMEIGFESEKIKSICKTNAEDLARTIEEARHDRNYGGGPW